MYSVYCDGFPLLEPVIFPDCILSAPVLKQTVNMPGELTFSILKNHPYFDKIKRLESRVSVYQDGRLIWTGRPIESKQNIWGTIQWVCEGCLAFLCDTIKRPFLFQGEPAALFREIVNEHNAQVNENQRLAIGTITVTDPNNYINRSSDEYLTSFDAIKTRLLETLGGYLIVTFSDGTPVLNYYQTPPDTSTQIIEYGENIQDFARTIYGAETYTACIPLGAEQEDGTRLTIKAVNSGNDYLINTTLAQQIGVIYAPSEVVTWDDVTLAANLKTKALQWLATDAASYKERVNLKAIDLHNANANIENFSFMDNVRVQCHDLAATYILTQINIPLNDPASTQITLGGEKVTLVSELSNQQTETNKRIGVIEADYVTNGEVAQITKEEIESSTWIKQTAEEIVSSALEEYSRTVGDDLETLYQSIRSEFSQLASQVSLRFNTIEQQTVANADAAGGLQTTLNEYQAWFHFLAQTSTQNAGLVIGESTSPIQMKLENDVLYFCTDPVNVTRDTAIAYFAAGALNVNFINVQNLAIGSPGQFLDVRIVGTGDNICALFSGRLS